MNTAAECLIIFTKYPRPGKAKTRMIPLLGRRGAADLARRMIEHTLSWAGRLSFIRGTNVEVHYAHTGRCFMKRAFGDGGGLIRYRPQVSGDLGEKMRHAFQQTFASGAGSVVIVGTDIPDLTDSIASRAFGILAADAGPASARRDMVLGPTRDGGYYLIGFTDRVRQGQIDAVLTDIPWSTAAVLERTERLARTAGLSYALLDVLDDVDCPRDLPVWHRSQRRKRKTLSATTVSVIIPALNEEGTIAGTIDSARHGGPGTEIIVVDGGSTDKTAAVARAAGAVVISSPPPRSRQMNAGARTARGDVLLFLHGDTALPSRYDGHIFGALNGTGAVAGAFMLGIDGKGFGLRAVEWMANMRSRLFQMPYGDQGLFIRADLFYETGGFPEIPIMDDFEMIRRLRKRGAVAVAPVSVTTSARRWRSFGVVKTTLINQIIIIAFLLGIPPGVIVRWYRREKGIG